MVVCMCGGTEESTKVYKINNMKNGRYMCDDNRGRYMWWVVGGGWWVGVG